MESQITLVDPSTTNSHQMAAPTIVLEASADSVNNTMLTTRDNAVVYKISSNIDATSTTIERVRRLDEREPVTVGIIDRPTLLPDKITFGDGSSARASRWLKRPALGLL